MLKTKTIKTDKTTLLVCELPLGAKNISIDTNQSVIPYGKEVTYEVPGTKESYGYEETEGFSLPDGNWQPLGRLPDIAEEQAEGILPNDYHKHLSSEAKWYWALLFDFLKENEVYFENPLGEEPNRNDEYYRDAMGVEYHYYEDLKSWQEAQSKVWDKERTYIFIKSD